MQFDRRAMLLAGTAGGLLSPMFSEEAGAAPVPKPGREVLAFYYGWYAAPSTSGHWYHWQDPGGRPGGAPIVDEPTLGHYDSHDPEIIRQHAEWLQQAGVTGIISSWWGQGTFEDESLSLIIDVMHAHGIKVTAYLEPGLEVASQEAAASGMAYLVRRYGSHPAWLKVDGRPVLFVYDASIKKLPAAQWKAAADQVGEAGLPRPVLIGDLNPDNGYFAQRAPAFEGLHTYVMAPYVMGKSPDAIRSYTDATYPKWKRKVADRIYCATVIPGFDDSRVPGRPLPRPIVKRNGTATFDELWRAAIKTGADWVLVTSFNEWHEGSEIEPSSQYGDIFLRRNKLWAARFLGGS